jgi:NAD+ synthase (glutamine-hydrolysing)
MWSMYLDNYRRNLRRFSPKYFVRTKVKKFNEYLGKHNLSGAVLSVSGGVDSALTLALLKKVKELPNSNLKKIWAINQPIHSSDWALNRARELCKKFEIELTVIDQTETFDNLTELVGSATGVKQNKFSGGQMRSYMRTPINYYCAQLLTQSGYPAVVMGTGNMDEDGYLAYFCKAGDGVVDVQLIADLHKSEVFKCAEYLGVPMSIVKAKPSADLWEDQEDEKELGFTYDFIEFYTGVYLKMTEEYKKLFICDLSEDSYREFYKFEKKCVAVHNRNRHKIGGVVNL